MTNVSASYFKEEFALSTESAAAIASIFGWMNLFARGLGGFASDKMNAKMGMRGRLIVQALTLTIEAIMVLIFARTKSLGLAIFILVIFSSMVQAAEGATYGIVPYVNPAATGSISGIVGAGGNSGAVAFGLCFRQLSKISTAFNIMGFSILGSAGVLTFLISIKGHRSILGGVDTDAIKAAWQRSGTATLAVPGEKDFDENDDDARS
jgi:NNP family nitrate/nitrite transporter-like MFS transporter